MNEGFAQKLSGKRTKYSTNDNFLSVGHPFEDDKEEQDESTQDMDIHQKMQLFQKKFEEGSLDSGNLGARLSNIVNHKVKGKKVIYELLSVV